MTDTEILINTIAQSNNGVILSIVKCVAKYSFQTMYSLLCVAMGYAHLQKGRATQLLSSIYQMQRALFKEVVAKFIEHFVVGKNHLNPQFKRAVNA